MQFSPLLLSLAAPLVADTARLAASTVVGVQEAFAHVFNSEVTSAQPQQPDSSPSASGALGPFGETLEAAATDFRGWLRKHGISTPFSVNFSSDASSGLEMEGIDIEGQEAERIRSLLSDDAAGWKQKFIDLASSFQAAAGPLSTQLALVTVSNEAQTARLV